MKRIFLPIFLLAFSFSNLFSNNTFETTSSFFLNGIVTQDSFFVQTSNCPGQGSACIDIPFDNIGFYTFTDNGTTYTETISGCDETIVRQYDYAVLFGQGMLGPYRLNDWDVNGTLFTGEFNNIPDLVDSMNLWDPTGNWILDQVDQIITGGTVGVIYDDMDVTVISINSPSLIKYTGLTYNAGSALPLDIGSHEVVVTDGTLTDTFYVEVVCVTTDEISNTIDQGQTEMFCFDQSELLGNPASVEILCSPNNGAVNFQLIAGNTCVEYTGTGVGVDTACFVVCDAVGICDTTRFFITSEAVSNIEWIINSISPNTSNIVCIDTTQLAGNVVGITNGCPLQSGEYVMFNVDASTFCVEYEGLDIGTDTACIYIIDDLGNVDTTYIITTVTLPPTDTIMQSILEGDSAVICLDTTQLGGNIISAENLCENSVTSGNIYTLDTINFCVNAQTTTMGTDSVCIVLCDDFGICDTTYLLLSVIQTIPAQPIAGDDSATTTKDATITINVCGNDVIPGNSLTNYYILPIASGGAGPNIGFAVFNNDCTITYTAEGGACDTDDQFHYVICNSDGCDTALVTVTVLCDLPTSEGDIKVYNAFSPNGDGENENFMIEGVENFPNSSLQIFNRWGNAILETTNYKNDWNGTWEGVTVQNGTYFYLFNDGEGNTYSGYLVIQR